MTTCGMWTLYMDDESSNFFQFPQYIALCVDILCMTTCVYRLVYIYLVYNDLCIYLMYDELCIYMSCVYIMTCVYNDLCV